MDAIHPVIATLPVTAYDLPTVPRREYHSAPAIAVAIFRPVSSLRERRKRQWIRIRTQANPPRHTREPSKHPLPRLRKTRSPPTRRRAKNLRKVWLRASLPLVQGRAPARIQPAERLHSPLFFT